MYYCCEIIMFMNCATVCEIGDLNIFAGDLPFGFWCHLRQPSFPQLLQAVSKLEAML